MSKLLEATEPKQPPRTELPLLAVAVNLVIQISKLDELRNLDER